MNKKIIMMVLFVAMLISVTGCGSKSTYPKVLIDTSVFATMIEIDMGDAYEYIGFDVAKTDTGKDVIIHFNPKGDMHE